MPRRRSPLPFVAVAAAVSASLAGLPAAWAQSAPAAASVKPNAGMLRYPDVSRTHIVFLYANDLWVVPRTGGVALPLSSPAGSEILPRFSPDGQTIAFVGNYDGNRDLYTIPAEGGTATRVTYHPAAETLCDWTPDGRLIFSTNGFAGLGRQQQLFMTAATGGLPTKLPVPYGEEGAVSPDGRWLAYTPHSTNNRTWKRYRGGMATDIWLFDLKNKAAKKVTDWEGTDTAPMWRGDDLYYLSDAGPEHRLNLWAYDGATGKRRQLTKYADYDVKWPSMGPGPDGKGEIVFQHGADLLLLDLATEKARTVEVRIPGDRPRLRERAVDASRNIGGWDISPNGKRAAVAARGDIWTLPAKDGTPRNLTRTPGANERDPNWSPDGRWIAYLSDATGEYELYVTQSDGKGETRQLTKDGKTFRSDPAWSPDGKHLLFRDNTGALFLHTLEGGATKPVDRDPLGGNLDAVWSPDSGWLAYSRSDARSRNRCLWLYNVASGEKRQVTSGMFSDSRPAFDRKGDFLYFVSNRSFQPTYEDFGTTWVYNNSATLLALPLRKDVKLPLAPKSDEEAWDKPAGDKKPTAEVIAAEGGEEVAVARQADEVSGTWSGSVTGDGVPGGTIAFVLTLTLGPNNAVTGTIAAGGQGAGAVTGSYSPADHALTISGTVSGQPFTMNLKVAGNALTGTVTVGGLATFDVKAERTGGGGGGAASKPGASGAGADAAAKPPVRVTVDFDGIEGRAFALPVRPGGIGGVAVNDRGQVLFTRAGSPGEPGGIKLIDPNDEKRDEKLVAAGAGGFALTPDGKKLLVLRGGTSAAIQDASAGAAAETVSTAGMTAQVEPRAEWRQMFDEAWRIERDYFYDPNMHGVDWKAVHDHYAKMLADCASREDVGYVISEMISELNVGHAYYSGGDNERPTQAVSVGMLGVDFARGEGGAYKITRVYRGAAWDSDARGPLAGLDVRAGDYLLAVNGVPVDTGKDPWAAFLGLAGRTVTITVSTRPKLDAAAREVTVRLAEGEGDLRYRAWIEANRAYVEKQTGGRVGYVYVPNTGVDGQTDLLRQLVGQRGKEALIIDERWNGGGQIPTRFIELLNRPVTNYWATRNGGDNVWPPDAHRGPKCMLINGLAGSGGDAFPYYFRQAGLGKLIGTRTWGGLVGISGGPELIDGASVTAPSFAFFKNNGTWGIEGHGVDPDLVVVDDPAKMADGGDPQLDAAIAQMLAELKAKPFVPTKRPAYPDRKGMGVRKEDQ
jgi:tricorn protease